MSSIPKELKYALTHEWAALDDKNIVIVGITDHAQNALGDVVYVELPEIGSKLEVGDEAGIVESVKAASDIYAPVSGVVVAINEVLEDEPELINTDPYTDGWFFKLRISDTEELDSLLTAEDYRQAITDDQ